MNRSPIKSENIKSIGHDARGPGVLHVEFHNGDVWQYRGVPASAHAKLMAADSIGSHFAAHIRDRYPGKKV